METSKSYNLENEEDKMESHGDLDLSSDSDSKGDEKQVREDDIEELELDKKIARLKKEIDENPHCYQKHIQLIEALRSRGVDARLREARERMSSLFPLPEDLWLDWLKDEPDKIEVYDRAIADFTTVNLCMEYISYHMRGMADADGNKNIRGAFEQAITAVGLNVARGSVVWKAYREFELAVLSRLITGSSDFESQMNRITKLFKQQLCVPLIGMENTYSEYKAWIEGEVDAETQRSYEEALKVLGKVRPLEESMEGTAFPSIELYNKYIELELSYGSLAQVKCFFERAVEQNRLIPDLWIRYTEFLLQNEQFVEHLLPVYRRSVRNCPWVVDLWLGLMRTTERLGKPKEAIENILQEAVGSGFIQFSELVELYMAYLDYLRRKIDWNAEHGQQLDELRNAFDNAINQLYQSRLVDGDPTCLLARYWAFIEAKFCRNMTKCRELWAQIMQSCCNTDSQMWIEYFQLERAFGDVKHCRQIMKRALDSVQDCPEVICEAFLRFEREEGDLEHFEMASVLCKERRKQIAAPGAELDENFTPAPIPPDADLIQDKEGFKIPPPIGEIPTPPDSLNRPPGYVRRSSISGDLSEDFQGEPPSKRIKCSDGSSVREDQTSKLSFELITKKESSTSGNQSGFAAGTSSADGETAVIDNPIVNEKKVEKFEEYWKQLKMIPMNTKCFDCEAPNPMSINQDFGVFICSKCLLLHQHLNFPAVYTRSRDYLKKLPWLDLHKLNEGGNRNAMFLCTSSDPALKYNTAEATKYKEALRTKADTALKEHNDTILIRGDPREEAISEPSENKSTTTSVTQKSCFATNVLNFSKEGRDRMLKRKAEMSQKSASSATPKNLIGVKNKATTNPARFWIRRHKKFVRLPQSFSINDYSGEGWSEFENATTQELHAISDSFKNTLLYFDELETLVCSSLQAIMGVDSKKELTSLLKNFIAKPSCDIIKLLTEFEWVSVLKPVQLVREMKNFDAHPLLLEEDTAERIFKQERSCVKGDREQFLASEIEKVLIALRPVLRAMFREKDSDKFMSFGKPRVQVFGRFKNAFTT